MPQNGLSYYSLNTFFKEKFGGKTVKLSIDGGFTCPNRDGKISTKGCIFCSEKGSGDFTPGRVMSIAEQIEEQKRRLSQKWPGTMYIAYFQAFTNTYAPVEVLRQRYSQAISQPGIIGLAIATRPDCIDKKIAELLKEFSRKTYVMVELGLQTSNENTAEFINRGYPNSVFENAVKLLSGFGIDTVCHIIIGLPGESHEDMLNSVRYACSLGINGIKLQMLNVLEGTDLGEYYKIHPFDILSLDQYTDIVARLLEYIPEDIVIHRLTGDGPRDLVIEPKWVFDKRLVLNTISKKIRLYNIVQGRLSKQP